MSVFPPRIPSSKEQRFSKRRSRLKAFTFNSLVSAKVLAGLSRGVNLFEATGDSNYT